MSPTAISAEAKVKEHEFCPILLFWVSKIVLLSEVEAVHKPAVREDRTAQQQQPCRVRALALTKLDLDFENQNNDVSCKVNF